MPGWFILSLAFVRSSARFKAKLHKEEIHLTCVPCQVVRSPLLGCKLVWAALVSLFLCSSDSCMSTMVCPPILAPLSMGGRTGVFIPAFGFGVRVQTGWASKSGSPDTLLSLLLRCRHVLLKMTPWGRLKRHLKDPRILLLKHFLCGEILGCSLPLEVNGFIEVLWLAIGIIQQNLAKMCSFSSQEHWIQQD